MTSEIYIPGFTVTCLLITSIICIVAVLVAYFTNRRWVFGSRTTGSAAMKEFLYGKREDEE